MLSFFVEVEEFLELTADELFFVLEFAEDFDDEIFGFEEVEEVLSAFWDEFSGESDLV